VRPITDVTNTALRKKERLFRMNSLKEGAVWHMYPLLGNYHKISSYTTFVAR
jgi:hypothetical protein